MGMPASCYTKALREPVFFLWERRHTNSKIQVAKYRSREAIDLEFGRGNLIYDHAVPFVYLQKELLELHEPTRESVRKVLDQYGTACLITKDEDIRLTQVGLQRKMPEGWDGSDALARYHFLGLEIVPNPDCKTVSPEAND